MHNMNRNSVVFRIDEKLLQRRPPRLTLAGTLAALSERMKSGDLEANIVIDILNENRLLPYMLGQCKNISDMSLGRNTNASKVGDLIVSEECIRGTYELCLAFLEFVNVVLNDKNYKDTTKSILASVIYIANEIYTSHHIWTYKNITDMNKILCLCTQIFHYIISNVREPANDNNYSELEIVCIISLSQNQAHKQLLDIIVEGRKTAESGEIRDESIISSIRQSLFIFNKLLAHSRFVKNFCDNGLMAHVPNTSPSTYQHGASSSNAPTTSIERALFDTNTRPGLLQNLFSFIYQKNDSTTACLAVDLIKNIATKFSMSLMACLGSEADKVCDFFVDCLGSKESKVDLEVAILDLLSTCVKHQPGLIELFLNYEKECKPSTGSGAPSSSIPGLVKSSSSSSLDVVMNLLKEGRSSESDSQKLLQTYVMKFILTFWQKHHSAIEQFDKSEEFWESITHPLIKFLETTDKSINQTNYTPVQALDDKLNSYALMILAREIFCLNVGILDRKMHPNLHKILNDLAAKNLLSKYSRAMKSRYSNISENLDKSKDYSRLLMSWRDFLVSCAKYKPIEISTSVKNQVVEDMLACMTVEIKLGEKLDKERMSASGDTLLLIWNKWMEKNSAGDSVFRSIHELLYLTDSHKEYLPFSFLLTYQSTLNLYLMRHRDYLIDSKQSFDLLAPALQLTQFSLKVIEKHLHGKLKLSDSFDCKPGVESRLCLASIMTTRFIIDVSRRDASLWTSYLQTNLKTDNLVQFLNLLTSKRVGAEICLAVVELLLTLSSIRETAEYLNKAALINQVNMIAVSAYERPYAHLSQLAPLNQNHGSGPKTSDKEDKTVKQGSTPMEVVTNYPIKEITKIYLNSMNLDHEWLPVYWHIIRLNISMILTLSKDYMATAVEYLSIHCIRICELFELLRTNPRSVNMEEALQMIYMINLVLRHGLMWRRRCRQSHDAISDEIAKTAYSLATSALPPPTTGQPGAQQHTSLNPRDCLVYARCCYDFGKYTEAERVLFQTKFGDKNGFIKEAAAIYGEQLSNYAFHLAALICLKTNRQPDSIDFALQVFADDPEHLDIVNALSQEQI